MHKLALVAIVAIGLMAATVSLGPAGGTHSRRTERATETVAFRGLRDPEGLNRPAGTLSRSNCNDETGEPQVAVWRCGLIRIARPDGIGGESLELWVEVLGPASTRRPPVVLLPGGPGRPGTEDTNHDVMRFRDLYREWDVIHFDPRGTGKSDGKLNCPQYSGDHWEKCFLNIVPKGIDVSLYSAVSMADDVEALRVALGIEEWNAHGASYGAEVAQHLVLRHPAALRSVVMSAPTSIDIPQPIQSHHGVREAVLNALRACEESIECSHGESDLPARFERVLPRLADRPLSLSDPGVRPMRPTETVDAIEATRAAWFTVHDWRLMHLTGPLLISLEKGDTGVWSEVIESIEGFVADGGEDEDEVRYLGHPMNDMSHWHARRARYFNWAISWALTLCNDGSAGEDAEDWTLGLPWWDAWRADGPPITQCANAGVASTRSLPDRSLTGPPMLILAGTHDSQATLTDANRIKQRFPYAHRVILPWYAHAGMWEDPCPQGLMQALWRRPEQPLNDSCVEDLTFQNIYGHDCERDIGLAVPLFCEHDWYEPLPEPEE